MEHIKIFGICNAHQSLHYIYFLSKLPQHINANPLRLQHFDCYILTTVCPVVSGGEQTSMLDIMYINKNWFFNILLRTYRSPNDPEAIFCSNLRSLGSTSQTSVESAGIWTKSDEVESSGTWRPIPTGSDWTNGHALYCIRN
jgi:hypothetical protein